MLNKEDFNHIYDLYYHPLCRYLYLFTHDFALIEDTVQTLFVKLWEEREKISETGIKSYLFIAARSRILNHIRDIKKREDLLETFYRNELINESADDIVDFDDFYNYVQQLVTQLPPRTKEIYKLSRDSKLSYKEISLQLDISHKTVEKHISNAFKYISAQLKLRYAKPLIIFFLLATHFLP